MDSTPPSSPLGAQPVPPVRKPIGVEVVSQKASPSQAGNHLAAILAARMERKQYWTPQNHKTCSIMFNRYETTSFQWFQSWRPPENRFQDSLSNTCARHSPPTTKTCHTKGYSTNRILLKISILLVVYIYIYIPKINGCTSTPPGHCRHIHNHPGCIAPVATAPGESLEACRANTWGFGS